MNINDLTIEEKVGQMLCFAFHGTSYNHQLDTFINEFNLGSVVYFARNINKTNEVARLNKTIQERAKIPLLIGLDQEGGSVLRIMEGITPLVGAMALAASDQSKIYDICRIVGTDLKHLGFNMNFAPVGDVNNNPLNPVINSRSYSDDPLVVGECVKKAYRGFQDSFLLPTIKHFPGHGNTSVDSHVGLPVVKSRLEDVYKTELIPFIEAINDGIDGVMMSHILFEAFDKKYPASLSYQIITKLLKEQLGFKGLIVTDSLTMGAIYKNYSLSTIIEQGVNSGNDILIFCGKADLVEQREIYHTFLNLVKNGKIPTARLDESVNKILKLKQKYCSIEIDENIFKKNENLILSSQLQFGSITLVKSNGIVPISKKDKILLIFPEIRIASLVDNENQSYHTLNQFLEVDEVIMSQESKNFKEITKKSKKYDKIILATYNVKAGDYQQSLFNQLEKEKTIVVSMRSPYDLLHLDGVENYICIYEPTIQAFQQLTIALYQNMFLGKLPVQLSR